MPSVDQFTAAVKQEFANAKMDAEVKGPPSWQEYTTVLPSTTKAENHLIGAVLPGVTEYKGYREYVNPSAKIYTLTNKDYHTAIKCPKNDIEDDQTGMYLRAVRTWPQVMQDYPGVLVQQLLRLGESTVCWDGANFFADSHNVGTVDNLITKTGSGDASGVVHRVCFLVNNPALQPVFYQERQAPTGVETDADTPQASEAKMFRYWADMRGVAGFGLHWDAIMLKITNKPTIAEVQSYIRDVEDAFRSFTVDSVLSGESTRYFHANLVPSVSTMTVVAASSVASLFRPVLEKATITLSGGVVENDVVGFGKLIPSAYLNA